MSGFECLADLIIYDDGVSVCDAGYGCYLCIPTAKSLMHNAIDSKETSAP